MGNLGAALARRFERIGELDDLEAAIQACREAVDIITPEHPDRAAYLNTLGGALRMRFERTRELADLNAAIRASSEAVDATPDDHPDRAMWLHTLGFALLRRFEWRGQQADLDAAIRASGEAVDSMPPGHPNHAMCLNILGVILRRKAEHTGESADLDAAIRTGQQAVDITPSDHPDRARCLYNLAVAWLERFEEAEELADLEVALQTGRQAVKATPRDRADRAIHLNFLGKALQTRFEHIGDRAAFTDALIAFRSSSAIDAAAPVARVHAARSWGRLAAEPQYGDWQDALAGYRTAMTLLPLVAPRHLQRGDREQSLGRLAGMAADAAAVALQTEGPGTALAWLEQGRGVLLAQSIDSRSDLNDLAVQDPGLAHRFGRLREELNADETLDPRTLAVAGSTWRDIEQRHRAATEMQAILAQIRNLPGFRHFLLPPPVEDLRAQAHDGPIAVMNVSGHRSDALIVTPDAIHTVTLPRLTPQAVVSRAATFLSALEASLDRKQPLFRRREASAAILDTLAWLWDNAAEPVLEELGYTHTPKPGYRWPRIWWCPTGPLSYLPVHAAGHHSELSLPNSRTVMDRVISSYTLTIRALTYARTPVTNDGQRGMLIVSLPSTPGAPDLPGAAEEARRIKLHCPHAREVLGEQAILQTVLKALPESAITHFACHGYSNPANPSASHLLLYDHQHEPLSVAAISRLRLTDAQLAYLSACSTARTSLHLVDEAVHIAGAFQLAGYRHVIATLWHVYDTTALGVADHVLQHPDRKWCPRYDPSSLCTPQSDTPSPRQLPPRTHPVGWLHPRWKLRTVLRHSQLEWVYAPACMWEAHSEGAAGYRSRMARMAS